MQKYNNISVKWCRTVFFFSLFRFAFNFIDCLTEKIAYPKHNLVFPKHQVNHIEFLLTIFDLKYKLNVICRYFGLICATNKYKQLKSSDAQNTWKWKSLHYKCNWCALLSMIYYKVYCRCHFTIKNMSKKQQKHF